MNDKQFDDFLQQQLQGSSPYLDDGDFSARVMASLPAQKAQKRLNPWVERLIACVPVTLIALLVLSQFSLREFIQPVYAWVITLEVNGLVVVPAVMLVLMFAIPLSLANKRSPLF
jgi:hypothetical protein